MTQAEPNLLLVEDEMNVGSTLSEQLKKEGYEVAWSRTRSEAECEIAQRSPDLAILDVGLPDGSGFEIAQAIRKRRGKTAIIFLTAFGSPEDRIRGLELGAEDYIVKPFHLKELMLRIQNGLKRAKYLAEFSKSGETPISIGKATVHFSKFAIESNGKLHPLTHKECALLKLLVERRGQVVSRDDILNEVWSEDDFPSPRTVDNFIVRLRRLLERNSENPEWIQSVRGVGYKLI